MIDCFIKGQVIAEGMEYIAEAGRSGGHIVGKRVKGNELSQGTCPLDSSAPPGDLTGRGAFGKCPGGKARGQAFALRVGYSARSNLTESQPSKALAAMSVTLAGMRT